MVAFGEGVGPRCGALERGVFEHNGVFEHCFLFAVKLESVVGTEVDAVLVKDFAFSGVSAAAWAVALVLHALRFWAEFGDVGQRAVAAVSATVKGHLHHLLCGVRGFGSDLALFDLAIDSGARFESGGVVIENEVFSESADAIWEVRMECAS